MAVLGNTKITNLTLLDGVIGNLNPVANNIHDLGTSSLKWRNIYGNLKGNAENVTGTVAVANGGTGATAFTANSVIISGNTTTAALTTRGIRNNTSAGALGWTSSTTDITLVTTNTIAYWDGRYQTSNNNSNLEYCKLGKLGTAAIHAHGDYAPASHGNHVPATQTANNAIFLRNDNTWQTVTPANIGAAPSSTISCTTANVKTALGTGSGTTKFLREDGTWQTPAYIANAAYGNLTTEGKITSTATIASGDRLVIVDTDSTAGNKITGSSITFGTATNTWLRNDGTWNTPTKGDVGLGNVENVAGNARIFYGTSNTAAGTAAKVVTCSSYDALTAGDMIVVKFDNANTAANPTLNVNSKGAKDIKKLYNGAVNGLTANGEVSGTCLFLYNGSQWLLTNADYNNTYSNQSAASGGTTVSLVTTGEKYTWNNKSNLALGTTSATAAAGDHIHGNLSNDGKITSTTTIANGDKLVIVDSDTTAASKITGSSITFDGSTATKCLTQKGTWESFMPGNVPVTNVAISADTTTNASYPLVFGTTSTTAAKTESLQKNSAKFYVNPSTGNIQATTFNGFTLAAASAKSVVTSIDTSASLPTSNAVKTFVEGKGYVTSSGVTSITLKAGAGITLDTDNTAITSTGTRTISISGLNTSSGSESLWLNQKGGWSTPTATNIGLGNVSNNSNLNNTTGTKGDIIYWSAANTPSHLGNTSTTTKQFLSITSQVPSWSSVSKSDVGLSNVENTKLSTWAGSTNITTLGTVTTGTWNATTIGGSYLGTMVGATSSTAGVKGAVSAPAAGDQEKYLQGDGTWDTPAARHGTGTGAVVEGSPADGANSLPKATGTNSHAEGLWTEATGNYSHAEGYGVTASGYYSHAEGQTTAASGSASHTEGYYTIANHAYQHVFGEYNIGDTSTAAATERGNFIEIVGNGTASNSRSNARTLDWEGNETISGYLCSKSSVIDASKANNNVSSTLYRSTFDIRDSADRIINRQEAVVHPDGRIGSYWYIRNYNTSGDQVAQKGILMWMAKDGSMTYDIANPANFCSAIGALPTSGGTMVGSILGSQANALGTAANPFHHIVLGGATDATMTDASLNPRITFQEGTETSQQVHLIYTNYDSYRYPAGLKVIGTSTNGKAWFEVDGDIYARYIYPTQIQKAGVSKSWVDGRDGAIMRMTSIAGYSPCISLKTTNGTWEMGTYDYSTHTDRLIFTYITDSNYNNNNNAVTGQVQFLGGGHVVANNYYGNGSTLSGVHDFTCTPLWTNSNVGSTFAAQTVTLSQSAANFKFLLISVRHSTGTANYQMCIVNTDGNTGKISNAGYSDNGIRTVTISGTSVAFTVAQHGSSSTANTYCIPYKIWGVA